LEAEVLVEVAVKLVEFIVTTYRLVAPILLEVTNTTSGTPLSPCVITFVPDDNVALPLALLLTTEVPVIVGLVRDLLVKVSVVSVPTRVVAAVGKDSLTKALPAEFQLSTKVLAILRLPKIAGAAPGATSSVG